MQSSDPSLPDSDPDSDADDSDSNEPLLPLLHPHTPHSASPGTPACPVKRGREGSGVAAASNSLGHPGRSSRWQAGVLDCLPGQSRLLARYVGHCNMQTDIKEVVFLGQGDQLVAAGSDDGRVFIYDAASGTPLCCLEADEDVANCVQGHPHDCVLATSGIESCVRLWGPGAAPDSYRGEGARQESGSAGLDAATKLARQISRNQERVQSRQMSTRNELHALAENPQLLQLLMSQLYGVGPQPRAAPGQQQGAGEATASDEDEDTGEGEEEGGHHVSCRVN